MYTCYPDLCSRNVDDPHISLVHLSVAIHPLKFHKDCQLQEKNLLKIFSYLVTNMGKAPCLHFFLSLSLTLLLFTRKQWLPSKFFLFYFRKKIHSGALSNMQTCTLWVHFVYYISSSSPPYWILTPSWSFEGVGIQSSLFFLKKDFYVLKFIMFMAYI